MEQWIQLWKPSTREMLINLNEATKMDVDLVHTSFEKWLRKLEVAVSLE